MRLLCALGLFLALLHVTSCLLIGAFNIQCFGTKKSSNKEVMDIIKQIVLRYDIILIQEVRDKDLSVIKRLMDLVNEDSHQFKTISSEPLGPGSHKERYLFLYRHQTVSVRGSCQYNVKGFNRPPYVVKFSSTQTAVKEFILIPIHTRPEHAVKEIDALADVVDAAGEKFKNKNIMVLGDFNAGSNYVKDCDWKNIRLFTEKGFHSLINDVATTMAESVQTHDRIVVSDGMREGVVKAEVFDFRDEYGLGDQAKNISDHFPVEAELN